MTEQCSTCAFETFNQELDRAEAECKTLGDFRQRMAEAAGKLPAIDPTTLDANRQAKLAVILSAFRPDAKYLVVPVDDWHLVLVDDCIRVTLDAVVQV